MVKIASSLKIMRIVICLNAFLMTLLGYWLAMHHFDFANDQVYWAALSASLSLAFANVHNDIQDVEVDKINHASRPLPAALLTQLEVTRLAIFLLGAALLSAGLAGWLMFLLTALILVVAMLYNFWAKRVPVLGKVIVAALSVLTLSVGYLISDQGEFPIYPMLAAFCFILAREFLGTISDARGDQKAGRKSLFILWGKARILQISLVLTLLSFVLVLLPAQTLLPPTQIWYLVTLSAISILPTTIAIISIWQDQSVVNIRNTSSWMRYIFFTSLLSFLWLV